MGAIKNFYFEEINNTDFDEVFAMEEPLSTEEIDDMLCAEFEADQANVEVPQFLAGKY